MNKDLLKEHRELEYLRSVGDLDRHKRRQGSKAANNKKVKRVKERARKLYG